MDLHIEFDVSSEFSLDTLAQELLELVDLTHTKVSIDPWGPGGGNPCVTVKTTHPPTMLNILLYLRKWELVFRSNTDSGADKKAKNLMKSILGMELVP